VAVSRVAAPIADETLAQAHIGKLAGPDRFHLQVRLA
jgi:hypothetical protein